MMLALIHYLNWILDVNLAQNCNRKKQVIGKFTLPLLDPLATPYPSTIPWGGPTCANLCTYVCRKF